MALGVSLNWLVFAGCYASWRLAGKFETSNIGYRSLLQLLEHLFSSDNLAADQFFVCFHIPNIKRAVNGVHLPILGILSAKKSTVDCSTPTANPTLALSRLVAPH